MRDVCTLLGVPFYEGTFFDPHKKYNKYAAPRNAFFARIMGVPYLRSLAISLVPNHLLSGIRQRFLLTDSPKKPMDPRAREFLEQIYSEDILKLQNLIGRDLSTWLMKGRGSNTRSSNKDATSGGPGS